MGDVVKLDEKYLAGSPLAFQQEMKEMFSVGLAVRSPDHNPFLAQVSAYRGKNLRFAALRFSPHSTSSLAIGEKSGRILVTLQKEGVAVVQQDGRESRIEAGDIFMIDPSRPFFIETGEILTHSVYVGSEAVRELMPDFNDLTARAVNGRAGTGALFGSMLDNVFSMASLLDEDTADRIADSLPYVLHAAFSGMAKGQAYSSTKLKQLHRQRVLRYIRENLRNGELSASMIAQAAGVSTRYLYALFSEEDEPLMKRVWAMRLERCKADLLAASSISKSIGEIAYYWGFNDVAHFSRAFKVRYGVSPRDFRIARHSDTTLSA